MSCDCEVFDEVFSFPKAESSPGQITSFCHIKLGGSTAYVLIINYREIILVEKSDNNPISTPEAPEEDIASIKNCVTFSIAKSSIKLNRTLHPTKNSRKRHCWYPRNRN